jgi:hypothetical protein
MPVFVLWVIALSSLSVAGDDSTVVDVGVQPGIGLNPSVNVRFGDLVHIEWTTNHSVSYELRFKTEIENGGSMDGPVDAGHGMQGNYTFYSTINGTYTLHFVTDPNSSGLVRFHILMTATSSESGIDEVWVYLGLALVAAVSIVVVVLLIISKRRGKEKQKGLVPVSKPPN